METAPSVFVPGQEHLGAPAVEADATSDSDARGVPDQVADEHKSPSRYAGSSLPAGRPSSEATASIPTVRLDVSPSPASVGDRVSIRVFIENAVDVRSAPFHLVYPADLLEFESASAGPFLAAPSAELVFRAAGPPGRLMVALSLLGGSEGASGTGELCTLHFRTLAPGRAPLTLEDLHVFFADRTRVTPIHSPHVLGVGS